MSIHDMNHDFDPKWTIFVVYTDEYGVDKSLMSQREATDTVRGIKTMAAYRDLNVRVCAIDIRTGRQVTNG